MEVQYKKPQEQVRTKVKLNVVKEQLMLNGYSTIKDPVMDTGNIIVYIGDVNKSLAMLPKESIDCVVTSPPYWKQRDYKHSKQIGQEDSYFEYIKRLTEVFNGVKRVLKPTGTFFFIHIMRKVFMEEEKLRGKVFATFILLNLILNF